MSKDRAWLKVDRKRWEVVRQRVLQRDGWACRACGRRGRLEVDHIEPMGDGDFVYDLDALQALCAGRGGCHAAKTSKENGRPLGPAQRAWQEMVDELL